MKIFFIFSILCISLFGAGYHCKAQFVNDIKRVDSLFMSVPKVNYKVFAKGDKNEIESTFSTMFIVYKNFVSSQDIDACVFQPSCSVYAIECIHHDKSKFIAFMKISDRLMRCHPLVSKGSYKIDTVTGKYYDPVEN
jgi:putative membrane protein insertion efficiency factor